LFKYFFIWQILVVIIIGFEIVYFEDYQNKLKIIQPDSVNISKSGLCKENNTELDCDRRKVLCAVLKISSVSSSLKSAKTKSTICELGTPSNKSANKQI
jgi:hypothetical protein